MELQLIVRLWDTLDLFGEGNLLFQEAQNWFYLITSLTSLPYSLLLQYGAIKIIPFTVSSESFSKGFGF